jgi:xanthine dehydrogenase accessory factor
LGPRTRTEHLLAEVGIPMAQIPIVSPVGLDLGSETPAEVAVSVIAQLLAVSRRKSGTPLHGRARVH